MALHPNSQIALQEIHSQLKEGQKIVFVSGNFNIVHPGHFRLLKFAKDCGDLLVVGVNAAYYPGVVMAEDLRLEAVRLISLVNYAFIFHDRAEDFIVALKPHFVIKGKEHEEMDNPEKTSVESYGGKLLFSSGDVKFSSLDLLKKEFNETNFSTIIKPVDFLNRHDFNLNHIRDLLQAIKNIRVTVIGDLIVDEYITCDPLGMSQEDPTIVVTPITQNKFVGGAGIVAAHAKGLGSEVNFISVIGEDLIAEFVMQMLESYGVKSLLLKDESRPTTLKQRYRAGNKTLLRVSHLKQHDIAQEVSKKVFDAVQKILSNTDLLIFSDFNYGCLPQKLVDTITELCLKAGVQVVADSQSSSQVGDVSRFKDTVLLTPTEREARLAVRDFNSGLVVLAEKLRKSSRTKNVVITLGSEGLLIHAANIQKKNSCITDRLSAFNLAPKDSAGAGDSFLVAASLGMVSGADIWKSTYLGSLAAACQVGRLGNIPLTTADILAEIAI